jgi:hypothetical protein
LFADLRLLKKWELAGDYASRMKDMNVEPRKRRTLYIRALILARIRVEMDETEFSVTTLEVWRLSFALLGKSQPIIDLGHRSWPSLQRMAGPFIVEGFD